MYNLIDTSPLYIKIRPFAAYDTSVDARVVYISRRRDARALLYVCIIIGGSQVRPVPGCLSLDSRTREACGRSRGFSYSIGSYRTAPYRWPVTPLNAAAIISNAQPDISVARPRTAPATPAGALSAKRTRETHSSNAQRPRVPPLSSRQSSRVKCIRSRPAVVNRDAFSLSTKRWNNEIHCIFCCVWLRDGGEIFIT